MPHFHIVTLFPEAIRSYLDASIIGKAQEKKKLKISYYDPKKFVRVSRRVQDERVDRRPYGGGPGMVLRPEPVLRAVEKARGRKRNVPILFFATDGEPFTEEMAKKLAGVGKKKLARGSKVGGDIILISGHYEGIDARVEKILRAKKVSMGPYVLTGGELPAATVIDAVARFVPGVLSKAESLEASRVSSPEVYTRPEILIWKGKRYRVPKVLLTGHHAKIHEWKTKRRNRT